MDAFLYSRIDLASSLYIFRFHYSSQLFSICFFFFFHFLSGARTKPERSGRLFPLFSSDPAGLLKAISILPGALIRPAPAWDDGRIPLLLRRRCPAKPFRIIRILISLFFEIKCFLSETHSAAPIGFSRTEKTGPRSALAKSGCQPVIFSVKQITAHLLPSARQTPPSHPPASEGSPLR